MLSHVIHVLILASIYSLRCTRQFRIKTIVIKKKKKTRIFYHYICTPVQSKNKENNWIEIYHLTSIRRRHLKFICLEKWLTTLFTSIFTKIYKKKIFQLKHNQFNGLKEQKKKKNRCPSINFSITFKLADVYPRTGLGPL